MIAPLKHQSSRGISAVELLIGGTMIVVIGGFVFMKLFRQPKAATRAVAAKEIATYLDKARLDSMRRRVTDVKQMAQVKVFNRQFYSVAIDADGDGELDIPLVMTFPEQGIEIAGPFPKTFIFDQSGQTVDLNNQPIASQAVILRDDSGASAVKLSNAGQATVVSAVKTN
jgi:hypothetical protein